ncbi:MAG: hypothetical protein KF723_22030 [Rhizobiaceae bacterium]|nr:hypothetical protein [Rhizobiaceae bacterium]
MSTRTPGRTYVARAVENEAGKGWLAEFGYPGVPVDYVLDDEQPAVYATKEAAELMALRVLRDSLNARKTFGDRREISRKLTGDEFAHELGLTDIFPSEWATMWGTKQDRVMQQIEGVQEVPFAARWILPVLRKFPGALEYAQKIVAEHTSIKPEWLERRRQRVESEGG